MEALDTDILTETLSALAPVAASRQLPDHCPILVHGDRAAARVHELDALVDAQGVEDRRHQVQGRDRPRPG